MIGTTAQIVADVPNGLSLNHVGMFHGGTFYLSSSPTSAQVKKT
jgi:hypothetical protein